VEGPAVPGETPTLYASILTTNRRPYPRVADVPRKLGNPFAKALRKIQLDVTRRQRDASPDLPRSQGEIRNDSSLPQTKSACRI